jgi:hypothetical protein
MAPRDISTDFWLSTCERQDIHGASENAGAQNVPAWGVGYRKKSGSIRACLTGIGLRRFAAPALPLGAAASEEAYLKLAYRWYCRLGLEGKEIELPKNR